MHVSVAENRRFVESITPTHDDDWLIVAGDIDEDVSNIERTFRTLADRFAKVIWVPGNHELWTDRGDPECKRGQARYDELLNLADGFGLITPEDDFPEWATDDEILTVVPLFLLYDYSFDFATPNTTKAERLRIAEERGVVCSDEFLLHPDPYRSIEDWCAARLRYSQNRLSEIDPDRRTILVNHFPLKARLTRPLRFPEFALWCGTVKTSEWHIKYRAAAVVSGHLHIPLTTMIDDVRFEEVSLGYPRQREQMPRLPPLPRLIAEGRVR